MWLLFASVAPALWAASNLIDRDLLDRRLRNPLALVFFTGLFASVPAVLIVLRSGLQTIDVSSFGLACLAGVTGLAVYYPYLRALQVATPADVLLMWNLAPVFVAGFAAVTLHEVVGPWQIAGGTSLVLSSVLASFRRGIGARSNRATAWMLLASALIGIEAVAQKALFLQVSFVAGFPWVAFFAVASAAMIPLFRPATRGPLRQCLRGQLLGLVVANEGLDMAAATSLAVAVSLGPVTLVHAVGAIQPVFVLLFAYFLERRSSAARASDFSLALGLRTCVSVCLAAVGFALLESAG